MKIGQISYFYQPVRGGQEIYIRDLQRIFIEKGFHSKVYQPHWGVSANDTVLIPRLPLIGRLYPYAGHYLFNWVLWAGYHQHLQKENVIIAHYAFFSQPVWDMVDKVIVLSHGIEWNLSGKGRYEQDCERISQQAMERFITVANDTDYLRHHGLEIESGKGFFMQVKPKVWFIPNCVDIRQFTPLDPVTELHRKRLILVPRQVTPDRGIDLAIHAFAIFDRENPGYTLAILGLVPKSQRRYFGHCQKLSQELGLREKVVFMEAVPHDQMPVYYASTFLTLIPTLRREGTSLSALESMACGAATVSTDVAGLKDLPTFKSGSTPEAMAGAMSEALQNRDTLSQGQMEMVRQVFNLSNWCNTWLEVIQQAISQSHSEPSPTRQPRGGEESRV